MTLEQFKEALVEMGYKLYLKSSADHQRYSLRNKEVCVQNSDGINIYFEINRKSYTVQHSQFDVTDFAKALVNIKKFEQKLRR